MASLCRSPPRPQRKHVYIAPITGFRFHADYRVCISDLAGPLIHVKDGEEYTFEVFIEALTLNVPYDEASYLYVGNYKALSTQMR